MQLKSTHNRGIQCGTLIGRMSARRAWAIGVRAGLVASMCIGAPILAQAQQSGSSISGSESVSGTTTPSAPAGATSGGVQPPTTSGSTSTPSTVQLGSVQGLGGGIRPVRMAPKPGVPLTLDDAVRISLANNLNIFTAQAQAVKTDDRVKEAKTGYLPKLSVGGNWTYTGNVATATFATTPGQPAQSIPLGLHTTYGVSAAITEPIDTSGAISATQGIAESQRDAQYWALDSARRQVILTTSTAYIGVLRAQSQIDVVNEELTDAQAHVDLAQKQLNAGVIARYDLLTAQTSLTTVQNQLAEAQRAYNDAVAGLNNAMGVSQDTTLQFSPLAPPAGEVPEFQPSLTSALKNRPELQQIDSNIKTAKQSIRLASASLLPSVGVQATYAYSGAVSSFGGLHNQWTFGVVGSWDPFDFGATKDREAQSRDDMVTTQYLREQAAQGIEYQVRQALNEIQDAMARQKTAQAAVALAREQLRLANVRYAAGTGTNTEVTDAETALASSETNLESAIYDYYTSVANYQRATGTEPLAVKPVQVMPAAQPAPAGGAPAAGK